MGMGRTALDADKLERDDGSEIEQTHSAALEKEHQLIQNEISKC